MKTQNIKFAIILATSALVSYSAGYYIGVVQTAEVVKELIK